MLWGLSPALDLLEEIKTVTPIEDKREINVLIVGAADARHILKTMAKIYTHNTDVTVNFYVLDLLVEFVARQMLLLTIAFEPSDKLGLREKANLWMEVYANSLLRPCSAEYVIQKSFQMIHMVTNSDFLNKRMPCINLDHMKYKEKDQLENVFRYWSENDYNISKHWDQRLRTTLGTRYDAKLGIFDWDYHMKLKDKNGTDLIHSIEYKQWRNTGVAFTWLEKEFSITNPTFALGIFPQGDIVLSHGFCGDMELGPYFTFGLNCEDKEMLKTINGSYKKRATDVTERNLIRIFHEIEHQTPYVHKQRDEFDLGSVIMPVTNLDTETEAQKMKIEFNKIKEEYSPIETLHKVNFVPLNALEIYPSREKYKQFFHVMYFSQGLLKRLNRDVVSMLKEGGPLILETRAFCFNLTKETFKEFENSAREIIENIGFEEIGDCDFSTQSIVRFKAKSNENVTK